MIQKLFVVAAWCAAGAVAVGISAIDLASAQDSGNTKKAARRGPGGLGNKAPDFPANLFVADATVAHTSLRHEWIDIPAGKTKLHAWIEYPSGDAPAPVVIVMHYDAGIDSLQRALADQLALEGFIAIEPDLLSGRGPQGGNFQAFPFPDEALRANLKVPPAEAMRLYKAAYAYGAKLPRSNGKTASLGCGLGGTLSFRFAAEMPKLSAAVIFYGLPPAEASLAKIGAPVLGLYGGDDDSVDATIEPTAAAMKQLGKSYESHVYPGATHGFLTYQVEGMNSAAIGEAWPKAVEFLKAHTK